MLTLLLQFFLKANRTLRQWAIVSAVLLISYNTQANGSPKIEIIGQSQTLAWFEQLQIPVMQGRFALGGAFYQWSDPDNVIWSDDVLLTVGNTPSFRSELADIVIITIGLPPFGGDYLFSMLELLDQVKSFYTNAQEIYLMPLISGPNGRLCFTRGLPVQPTLNREEIVVAGSLISNRDPQVFVDPIIEVLSCSDYNDEMGHMTIEAYERAAREMTLFVIRELHNRD